MAGDRSTRPRYKILPDDLTAFENARAVIAKATQAPRRKKQHPDVIEFF
jgi:hypothetical protein